MDLEGLNTALIHSVESCHGSAYVDQSNAALHYMAAAARGSPRRLSASDFDSDWSVIAEALRSVLPGVSAQCSFSFDPCVQPPADAAAVRRASELVGRMTGGGTLGADLCRSLACWDGIDLSVGGGLRLLGAAEIAAQTSGEYAPMLKQVREETQSTVDGYVAHSKHPAFVQRVLSSQGTVPSHFVVATDGDSMSLFTMDAVDHRVYWTSLHAGVFGGGVWWPDYKAFVADLVDCIVDGSWSPDGDSMSAVLAQGRTSRAVKV